MGLAFWSVLQVSLNQINLLFLKGFLSGGFLFKWINRQLLLTFLLTLLAVLIALMPHFGSLIVFFICVFLTGIGGGSWESGHNIWIAELWPKNSGAVMQFASFINGVGSFSAPTLLAPYLHGDSNTTTEVRIHELTKPFAIAGILQLFSKFKVQTLN